MSARRVRGAWSALLVYLAGWVAWVMFVNISLVLAYRAIDNPAKPPLTEIDFSYLPGWVLPFTFVCQFVGMLALVPFARRVLIRRVPHLAQTSYASIFAVRLPAYWTWIPAALIGLTMGVLPGWIATQLRLWLHAILPHFDMGAIEMINEMLTTGSLGTRISMAAVIVIIAPVVEELVFRGYFWRALRRRFSARSTWVITSLIFAAYHMDPIQGTALLFSAFAMGWVRWKSGSIWPSMLVHVLNNGLGVLAAYGAADAEPNLFIALLGATITLLSCAWLAFRAQPARA